MTDPFLIAHRVRGKPAFDVASRLPCPLCQAYESVTSTWCEPERQQADCDECDRLGFWWIIPTSGHRAYPYRAHSIKELTLNFGSFHSRPVADLLLEAMPPNLPDHYIATAEPGDTSASALSLAERLGLTRVRAPTTPLVRRL